MRTPTPFPAALRGQTIRTADAPAWAITERRMRARDVAHPFYGIIGVELRLDSVLARCRAYEPRVLDGQVFSHVTALALWGAPIQRGRAHSLHLSVRFPRTPPRLAGTIGHSLQRVEPASLFGLPTSTAAAAWCESAGMLDRIELVAAGDGLVTGPRIDGVRRDGVATVADLRAALAKRCGSPGAGRALWAIGRIRVGVDSFAETQLRLLLVRHRLAEPVTDCPIVVAGLVLHSDLGYPQARIAIEFEGDQHRTDRRRWMQDIRRRELMEDAGWRVIRVTQADLDDPTALIVRLRRLLAARGR